MVSNLKDLYSDCLSLNFSVFKCRWLEKHQAWAWIHAIADKRLIKNLDISSSLLWSKISVQISYLLDASSLLIKMKRKQLQHNRRKRARQEGEDESSQKTKNKKTK